MATKVACDVRPTFHEACGSSHSATWHGCCVDLGGFLGRPAIDANERNFPAAHPFLPLMQWSDLATKRLERMLDSAHAWHWPGPRETRAAGANPH
jgi:hypothetical protein